MRKNEMIDVNRGRSKKRSERKKLKNVERNVMMSAGEKRSMIEIVNGIEIGIVTATDIEIAIGAIVLEVGIAPIGMGVDVPHVAVAAQADAIGIAVGTVNGDRVVFHGHVTRGNPATRAAVAEVVMTETGAMTEKRKNPGTGETKQKGARIMDVLKRMEMDQRRM